MSADIVRTPAIGDIWLDMDPRAQRFVQVLDVTATRIGIMRVVRSPLRDSGWQQAGRNVTTAKLSRFNGKRGGYQFVEQKGAL